MDLLTTKPQIFVTFLLKVYYSSVKWFVDNKSEEMRNCRVDSDWEYVRMDWKSWHKILDVCMCETIEEKRIRKQDKYQNCITLIQMIIVVSELFCILEQYILQFQSNECDHDYLFVNFKNHFAPKSIYETDHFIWFAYQNLKDYGYQFPKKFLKRNTPNSITTYEDSKQYVPLCYKYQCYPILNNEDEF